MQVSTRDALTAEYGPVMDSKDLCRVLRYPSVAALKASLARGKLPCRVFSFPGRRGLFARTEEVAEAIDLACGIGNASSSVAAVPPTASPQP